MFQGRRRWTCQLKKKERICTSFTFVFHFTPQWIGYCPPTTRDSRCLYSVHWIKCQTLPGSPSWTHQEIMYYQLSRHPLGQSNWRIKLTITLSILMGIIWLMPTFKPCFWCLCTSLLCSPLSKSPSLAGKLDREWAKMTEVRVEGRWCIFHPLSQTGEPGSQIGMMSEEEFHAKKEEHF